MKLSAKEKAEMLEQLEQGVEIAITAYPRFIDYILTIPSVKEMRVDHMAAAIAAGLAARTGVSYDSIAPDALVIATQIINREV